MATVNSKEGAWIVLFPPFSSSCDLLGIKGQFFLMIHK